ncbi:non-ribosomal peptide synthetase [Tumebacillus avium]|nr:non-ribosomal peptide synthetase [Tumebacillus avium]
MTVNKDGLTSAKQALLAKMLSRDKKPQQTIKRQPEREWVPASYPQKRLWFLDQLHPGNAAYNIPYLFRIQGELDSAVLKGSIEKICKRHDVLRVRFEERDGEPCQKVDAFQPLPYQEVDLQAVPENEREVRAQELLTEWTQLPFDLQAGQLVRMYLVKLDSLSHILMLNVHHIVSDGWSAGVLFRELTEFYRALLQGTDPQLKELPIQYADYSVWQNQRVQEDGALAKSVQFWKEQLQGELPLLQLPTDRPRPLAQSFRGQEYSFELSAELSSAVKELCRQQNVSLYMVLLAAYKTLLLRYTAQEDVLVGSPVANRNLTETEDLIGFFVNTLVMRTDLSGNPTFLELLERVKTVAFDAFANQDVPFEKLVEELKPERTLSHSPLFQTMFAVQNAPASEIELPGVTVSRFEVDNGSAKYDLTLFMEEQAAGLKAVFEYNSDLFDRQTMERMAEHFANLLESIVAKPEQKIGELPFLSAADLQQQLVAWNDTTSGYPQMTLPQLVEAQVAKTPDAVALIDGASRITYAELNARANQMAQFLQKRGIGAESLVGLCMERTEHLLISILGILKAGGAYVPLDPNYPQERILFTLEDAQVALLLTEGHLAERLSEFQGEKVCLEQALPEIAQESTEQPINGAEPHHLGYVIYTSGSTGRPKGVAIEHRSAATLVQWAQDVYTAEELAGVLFSTSICFDLSIFEMFVPLSTGGKVILAQNALHLPELPAAGEVTLINTVPSAIAELHRLQAIPANVKVINLAGEPLKKSLVQSLYELPTVDSVYNLYGPSEDTTYSTFAKMERNSASAPLIGRPVADTKAYVLNSHMQPVPLGASGELYLGGAGLARGYLNRPELTAEKFILNPFLPGTDERLYRTGDLVRYLPDGSLDYLGRIDHQVKVRGFRIELGEIEAVLAQDPSVLEVTVIVREDTPNDPRVVAYVVAQAGVAPTVSELRQIVKQKLPEYMVPSAFVMMDALPLTPNGKIDRNALPTPEITRDGLAEFVAPRTPLEEQLAAIWSELLGVERVGIEDNFFALGGHSLLATQAVSRIRQHVGVEVPLRVLFEQPTLAALSEHLSVEGEGSAQEVMIPALDRTQTLPLSFAQQRLWFFDQLVQDEAAYIMPSFYRLTGPLEIAALEDSLGAIALRHESLRTVFRTEDNVPQQVILPPSRVELPLEELSEAELEDRMRQDARVKFDLEKGPLFRAKLYRTGDEEFALMIVMHHIISDGWSLTVFMQELMAQYEAFRTGQPAELAPLSIQYADFAAWQRDWLQGEVLAKQLSYWKEQFTGEVPVLQLPTDLPRPAVQRFHGAYHRVELSAGLLQGLKTLCSEQGATLFMTLLTAYKTLLHRYSGQEDIVVGTPIANRTLAQTEPLIGFFANTLALRTDLSGNPSFRELLGRVREGAFGAFAHQDLPFEKLVEELQIERDMSRTPVFQTMFVMQNTPEQHLQLADLTVTPQNVYTDEAEFELTLIAEETAGGLVLEFNYNTDLFVEATISRMAAQFQLLLEAIAQQPDEAVAALPLLTPEEFELMKLWNTTAKDFPAHLTVQEMFERQVDRDPDALAVEYNGEQLTYGQLNRKANQLARTLREAGVQADSLVGIMAKPSLEMIVAVLAVLKAGGAYMPLDIATPRERVLTVLTGSGTQWFLTYLDQPQDLSGFTGTVYDLTSPELYAADDSNLPVQNGPEHLFVVLHTSGTTGVPKGVMLEHRNLVCFVDAFQEIFRIQPEDRFLQQATLAFDNSLEEIFPALLSGASLFIVNKYDFLDMAHMSDFVRDKEITAIATTSLVTKELNKYLKDHSLRILLSGGDALKKSYLTSFTGVELYNTYGPTETTVFSSLYLCDGSEGEMIPLGQPIFNEQVWILDKCQNPAPLGVTGELFIGGLAVGRGYLDRPELTAEKFIENPFAPGQRLYGTGDLARWMPNGILEFVGRADHQVKIRGFRVEVSEIEANLIQHEKVKETIVVTYEDEVIGKYLTAYLVLEDGVVEEQELRDFLKDRLPEYMIPTAFVVMEKFQLNVNAKVDRKLLPMPSFQAAEEAYLPPSTPTEHKLAEIWAEELGAEKVGANDHFFRLGGHSLLVTRVIFRLRKEFAADVPVRALFETPLLSDLAARIDALPKEKQGVAAAAPTIKRAQRTTKKL